jgi:hypothetical protein
MVPPHIPYARFEAALRTGNLRFIEEQRTALTLTLADEARVCRLIAEQKPAALEEASVRWIKRFARDARGERRSDYGVILRAFETLSSDPETGSGQLVALCTQMSLDR